jgi:serine/threonine protein kinase/tetratricopeptide (TPR) repeat protein
MADASETRGPDGTVTAPAPPSPAAGLRIGPYRVLREVGHGGMGAVFLAARADDQYQKRVAIKVVKSGAFGEDAVRHFRRERQILASLDHPNIAKLLDGGATDEGLPYIVMDHIEGQPIDRYCDAHQLPTADRLKLFRSVCGAVQYAHRNLVVHRDIKPSNVLVTTDGVPKLLDFGVAKLLNPGLSGEPLTATGLAMTPEYASPEQARGEPITTATDVYSLGVLLYELLTGRRPYRLKSHQAVDVLRAVCEEEPERPSTAVGRTEELPATDGASSTLVTAEAVSQARAATPDKLQRRLKGDLDNIVMTALRKEPQRRYPSVEALSEDIRRHLQGLPVTARKSTFGYRAGKFVRRNKTAVTAAVAIAALILAFGATSVLQSRRIALERDQAARERDKAEKVAGFLVGLFKVSQPDVAQGKEVSAREVLDRSAAKIDTELKDQPEVRATLLHTIGDVYMNLGLYDKALPLLEEALRLRRQLFPGGSVDVASTLAVLGKLYSVQDDLPRAEPLYREALAMRRRLLGNKHAEVAASLNGLAIVLNEVGKHEDALALHREALAIRRSSYGNDDPSVLESLNSIGVVLFSTGDFAGAEKVWREVLAAERRRGGQRPKFAIALDNLANAMLEQGNFREAEPLARESLEMRRRVYGGQDHRVAYSLVTLGTILPNLGRSEEAEAALRDALVILRKAFPRGHYTTSLALSLLGGCLLDRGSYAEAEPLLLESEKDLRGRRDAEEKELRAVRQRLVRLYDASGQPDKATPFRVPPAAQAAPAHAAP